MNHYQKLQKWVGLDFKKLKSQLFLQGNDSEYQIFGRYKIIKKNNNTVQVWERGDCQQTFGSTRLALSWCIAEKFQKYSLANRISAIDTRLQYLKNDVNTRIQIAKQGKNEAFRNSVANKVETKLLRQKQLEKELTECVNLAKYFQYQGTLNETTRTSNHKTR